MHTFSCSPKTVACWICWYTTQGRRFQYEDPTLPLIPRPKLSFCIIDIGIVMGPQTGYSEYEMPYSEPDLYILLSFGVAGFAHSNPPIYPHLIFL